MKILEETEETSPNLRDTHLTLLIQVICALFVGVLAFPYFLVPFYEEIQWIGISALGFRVLDGNLIMAPVLTVSSIIILINLHYIFQSTRRSPQWADINYVWILFCLFLFLLLTKRQQLLIVFQKPMIVIAAQEYYVPHPAIGYFIIFFCTLVLLGLLIIRGRIASLPPGTYHTSLSRNALLAVFLFLLPFHCSYREGTVKILLGIGYGFTWNGDLYCNAAALEGWIFSSLQVFLLLLIISQKNHKKIKMILILLLLGIAVYSSTQIDNYVMRLYIPGGHGFEVYPPMSPILPLLWWLYGQIGWDFLIST